MPRSREAKDRLVVYALNNLRLAYGFSRAHSKLAAWGDRRYGDHGAVISGCHREHFPEDIKRTLRDLALAVGEYLRQSEIRWKMAGKRRATWIRAKDATIARDGMGFYG